MMEYDVGGGGGGEEQEGVMEWEEGLACGDDLTPLSQPLISSELASAFRIMLEPSRTMVEVNCASQNTLSSLRGGAENDVTTPECSDSRKLRKIIIEECSEVVPAVFEEADSGNAKTIKRARLVWTAQLHKRFVDVVAHLDIKHAVPKTIMRLMNVEGLTRENVASHLQKYRLYLRRMQDGPGPGSGSGSGSSDHLLSSTPLPQGLHASGRNGHTSNGHLGMRIQMSYPMPQMAPMPMFHGYHVVQQQQQQRDWAGE